MTISRDEAREALSEIGRARGDIRRVHHYGDASPFLILWGAIWLLNVLTDFRPELAGPAWLGGIVQDICYRNAERYFGFEAVGSGK